MMTTDGPASRPAPFREAAPFWMSILMVPLAILSATQGGLWVIALPIFSWGLFSLLDALIGLNQENADTGADTRQLFWYRLITMIWFPIQFCVLVGMLAYVPGAEHLSWVEKIAVFVGVGVVSGTIGITYAHELVHQPNRLERWLGDLLMASVLYSHFRSEHLLVHHRYVGTPRDAVTARYDEGFYTYFLRVLRDGLHSAFKAEAAMLARKRLPNWHRSNPFWLYIALQVGFVLLAVMIAGWAGLFLFLLQAFVAIWQLELVDYVEHYGLTRKHLGDGKYEQVRPCHSWNATHRASNWLLINLQRHSDHHYKPMRRFPLLQAYGTEDAPQLPHGYPVMTILAMVPTMWKRRMNPAVQAWRAQFYPEIEDWALYDSGTLPMPR